MNHHARENNTDKASCDRDDEGSRDSARPGRGASNDLSRMRRAFQAFLTALCWYYVALFPLVGSVVSVAIVPPRHATLASQGLLDSLANWDGRWYAQIVTDGYSYNPAQPSSVAFFPVFPALAWAMTAATPLSSVNALLIISHLSLLLLLMIIPVYLEDRPEARDWTGSVIVAVILWPMSIFFRFAYTESLFVLLTVLVLLGNRRRWPVPVVALIAGTASGVRSVGIVPAALVMLRTLGEPGSIAARLARAAACGVLSVWALLAFMVFQQVTFDDMFAFCRIQSRWGHPSDLPAWRQAAGLVLLEPVWSVYIPSSPNDWALREESDQVVIGLTFWNPLFFVGSIALTGLGIRRRWLTRDEALLALGLLLVPYVLQGQRLGMLAQGRFAGAVFPCYLVLGRLLMSFPPPMRAVACGLSASVTTLLALLFTASYRVF